MLPCFCWEKNSSLPYSWFILKRKTGEKKEPKTPPSVAMHRRRRHALQIDVQKLHVVQQHRLHSSVQLAGTARG